MKCSLKISMYLCKYKFIQMSVQIVFRKVICILYIIVESKKINTIEMRGTEFFVSLRDLVYFLLVRSEVDL